MKKLYSRCQGVSMNLFVIFLTGLTTGGLSCLAMQGGLLASVIANQKDDELEKVKRINLPAQAGRPAQAGNKEKNSIKWDQFGKFDQLDYLPVVMFLLTKLIAHTMLGFLLGLLGSVITLSLGVRLGFQFFTALFMFATAMNLLDVHPIFRYVSFQPPKFITRLVRNTSKSRALFAPAILGLMTIFVPCGVTQAMEVLAINSGNPIYGALIMFSFVLGTSPLFLLLGVATAKLSEGWHTRFTKFAAYTLILMAIYGINGVLIVIDAPITINKIVRPITYFFSDERFESSGALMQENNGIQAKKGVQQVNIEVLSNGYKPNRIKVKKGVPVRLTLTSNGVYSCALSFVLKEFGINAFLDATDQQSFTFTPTETGKFTFTCSMGMYSGVMEVTN